MLADAESRLSYLKIVTPKRSQSQAVSAKDTARSIGTKHYVYKDGGLKAGSGEVVQRIPLDQRNYTDAASRQFLQAEMQKFLFEGGSNKPEGYVPAK